MQSLDLSLYVVTDRGMLRGRSLEEAVKAAIAGGATAIQLREKEISTRQFVELGLRLRALTREAGVTFIINDRLDVALAVDADGVHVGQDDMPVALVRRLIGSERIVGASASGEEGALQAQADGADYLGCTVFATPTKTDTGPPLGLEGFRRLVERVSIPVVGIGGINAANAAAVMRCGPAGVAVVSAVMAAEDIEAAARTLRQIIDQTR